MSDNNRTIEALKLVVDELEAHSREIQNVKKVQQHAGREFEEFKSKATKEMDKLNRRIRDLEIAADYSSRRATTGELAEKHNLTSGRISQITEPYRKPTSMKKAKGNSRGLKH